MYPIHIKLYQWTYDKHQKWFYIKMKVWYSTQSFLKLSVNIWQNVISTFHFIAILPPEILIKKWKNISNNQGFLSYTLIAISQSVVCCLPIFKHCFLLIIVFNKQSMYWWEWEKKKKEVTSKKEIIVASKCVSSSKTC